VIFDVAVCAALYRLSERWHPRLAVVLASSIALDAVLTLVQSIVYDLPRHREPLELVVMFVAVLAPTAASTLLWMGRAHRRRPVASGPLGN
jgi:hypothetical protein